MGQVTVGGTKVQFALGDILKVMQVLGSIIPTLVGFIRSLESHDMPGEDKQTAALAFIESLLRGGAAYCGDLTDGVIGQAMSFAHVVVDAIVAAFNKVGLFTHKAA